MEILHHNPHWQTGSEKWQGYRLYNYVTFIYTVLFTVGPKFHSLRKENFAEEQITDVLKFMKFTVRTKLPYTSFQSY